MAPARAALPGFGPQLVGFTARSSVTPPRSVGRSAGKDGGGCGLNSSGAAGVRTRAGLEGAGTWGARRVATAWGARRAAATDTSAATSSEPVMDSVLEEDVTLPGTLSGCSGLVPKLPDDLHGVSPGAGLGNGVLPNASEETVSPTRARNMKDFENQITELKKENFNLKLRIYFLEERMQQEFDGPTEHICKMNIELKVEVESLKRELQERERLLIKASKAVESLAEGRSSEVRRVKEDAQRKVQQVEDLLTKRVFLLQEDVKAAQAELEKAFAGAENEKALRLSLEKQLSEMRKMHKGDSDAARTLEDRDRLMEEVCKETVILCLKGQKSQVVSVDENVSSGELQGLSAAVREEKERETEAAQTERQEEKNRFEERIQALQEDLREKEREIATEKKNSLKRDKAIQGLTMALKSKEKEVEELHSEIKELNAAFAKAREARQKTQESEDYEAALLEKAALLAELHSENLTKSAENHSLRRDMKKVTQELSDLQQEKERLEKDLEAARREQSRGDGTIPDLRNEAEKLRNKVNEKEKAVENHYKSLLSESNEKLYSQGQVIRRLTGSTSHADEDLLQKFNEKDSEAIQQNRYLMTVEDFKFRSEDLITEKCSSQPSPGSESVSEEKQQLNYEELIQVLKKERDIYSHLVKSLQDSDSADNLQAELDNVQALRRQLEQEVLSYRNLQKMLEERISEVQRREVEEPFSFYSDQTSYLSICLEEHNRFQVEQFSQEELKKKVSDLIQLVKELYTDNQHLKKAIFDLSCMGYQGDDRLESVKQTEIVEDCSKGGCKNGYFRHTDSSILDSDGAHTPGCPGDASLEEGELLSLLAPFFSEKATLLLESRYNSLVQSQARELSLQRQQIKESHGVCVVCRQHMNTVMKAFGELLRASDVDYYVAEGFREQLNQCAGLLEKLEKLFLSGKSAGVEMSAQNELLERTEKDSVSCPRILPESPQPSASHSLSNCEMSEKSSSSHRDQKQDSETEKTSVLANNFSQDLLMEHIQEIRSLRKRLEESIKTNEKLRRQLERRGSEFDQGSANIFAYGSELHNSLMSEIRFLRKQNQALNTMLARGSRDKQKENEKLRESLSRKTANLEHLQQELACVKGENERLQKEAGDKDRQNQQLLQELCGSRSELSRVQEELQWRQQLLAQNNRLLQSLRVELKVFEKLDEEHRIPRESRAEATGEGWQGQDPASDLHGLLTEVQALRAQLERSIDTNSALQSRLEEQLANGEKKAQEAALTVALQALPAPEWPLQLHNHGGDRCPVATDNSYALFGSTLAVTPRSASQSPLLPANDLDSLSCVSVSSATSTPCTSHLVPGHHLWASKSGCHVLGLIEDYDALCKQIGQGQKLLAEMDTQIQEAPSSKSQELETKGLHSAPLSRFVTSVNTAKLILEEAARLLTLLWRVSLPTHGQCTHHCEQTGEMKAEITKLQKKLFEQEKNMQNTMKLLQLSKHQEKVIFDQLVVTHKILRKARGNLELRPMGAHPGTSSPSRPGS
ncbi:CDK5 regulatory subunit-associated protein 2 isoform 8-T9 [Hipposideros larvatus]